MLLMTTINLGCSLPSGTFVPSLLIGGVFGRMMGILFSKVFNIDNLGIYAYVGCGAFITGNMRIPMSIVVIMIEYSGNASYIIPIVLGSYVANYTSKIFGISVID